jgi:hypothetical protein
MIINKRFDYKPLTRQEENGLRKYNTPDGKKLVSVTTILGKTKDLTHIKAWQERVGMAEAEKIKTEASGLGNGMHKNLERYILGEDMSGNFMSQTLAKVIIKNGLSRVNEIWGSEVALYSTELYAGTTDVIGLHDNIPSIIDFKNSLRDKKKEWIEDYFLQCCAYSLSHNEMYNTDIKRGVIMIATREAKYQEFIIEGDEFEHYTVEWCRRLEKYYNMFPDDK